MISRIIAAIILVPLAILIIALAVVNRQAVPLTLDLFGTGNPGLSLSLPFSIWLLIALILGMIIGGIVSWIRQGRYRYLARKRAREVEKLQKDASPRQEEKTRDRDWPYGRDDGADTGVTGTQLAGLPARENQRA